jgi:hypothetical protein
VKADAARREAVEQAARQAIARAHRDSLVHEDPSLAGLRLDALVVPGIDATLQPHEGHRRAALLSHVDELLVATASHALPAGNTAPAAAPVPHDGAAAPADPGGLVGAACGTCRGHCCRTGGNTGWLDEASFQRIRAQFPALDDAALRAVYELAMPAQAVAGSCVFHGAQGCTLDRGFRADICNEYLCPPILAFLAGGQRGGADVVVIEEAQVVRHRVVRFSS